MSETILHLLTRRRKPAIDAVTADRLSLMVHRVRQLGDRERDLNRWRAGYAIRTGKAA